MTIDRGSNAGVVLGQRYLVFRDKRDQHVGHDGTIEGVRRHGHNTPLVEVGEVLVVAVRADDATVQVVASRDAISHGDLIAPIRYRLRVSSYAFVRRRSTGGNDATFDGIWLKRR